MRGTQAKKLRRMARQMCNPQLTGMHGKRFKSGAITAFWPNGSYRRILRSAKKWFRRDQKQREVMLELGART